MSVQNALLALLCKGPQHGYQLKAEFDAATGEIWPLNFGQVYPTLKRLQERGLIEELDDPEADRRAYVATDDGRAHVLAWLGESVARPLAERDELSIKLLVSLAADLADPIAIIAVQRAETMATLQSVTRMRAETSDDTAPQSTDVDAGRDDGAVGGLGQLAWELHLDRMAMLIQSEIRWLDLVEERLATRPELFATPDPTSTAPKRASKAEVKGRRS